MKIFIQTSLFLLVLITINFSSFAQTTRTVGTGGDYLTLNDAFTAIYTGTLTGGDIVFEIITDITETSQSYIMGSGIASANYSSIKIYPTAGSRTITADFSGPILNFHGSGSNITFDGRIDETGSDNQLTISNANASGYVFRIYSEEGIDNVTIQYCDIIGSGEEIILLSADDADITNTLIDNCNIGSQSTTATNGIYSNFTGAGTGTITATVSNCNIYNFWNASSSSKGVFLESGNENWTISDNNFYQTTSRTATAANTHYGIYIDEGDGHTITNNYIGGSEPLCGGTAWTINGEYANKFVGIYLNVGSATPANVNGNVIRNFNHTYHSTTSATDSHGIWAGIYLAGGNANIGSVSSNAIGSTTANDDIVINSTAAANVTTYGIGINATGANVDISNNQIGGFTLNASSTINGHSFTGIQNSGATEITIDNNTIGSSSVLNNIASTNPNESADNAQNIRGIENTANATISISNNTISNLDNSCIGKGDVIGIYSDNGINHISENNISKLNSSAIYQFFSSYHSLIGISISSSLDEQLISKNTIHSLSNSNQTRTYSYIYTTGILYLSGSGTVSQNLIYNITFEEQERIIFGLYSDGNAIIINNTIRLGNGYSFSNPIIGIYSYGGNKILGNSVYITGTPTGEDNYFLTYAYCIEGNGTDEVKNNIFLNNRTFDTYSHHFAIGKSTGSTLESDHNNLLTTDPSAIVSYQVSNHIYDDSKYSFAEWQTASGNDANSLSDDPQFVGADDAIPDLHISASSPMINIGTSVYPLVVDIDDDIRDLLPDIGCDEYYTSSVMIGEGQTYTTLKQVFDAINAGTITGNISINIQSSTTETETATLYQSGYNGTSDYTSVSIGTVNDNISVSGNIATPIISFNGAHNVNMVDISVENENANGYCIQFTNSASNNRIAGCEILGNTQLTDKGLITFGDAGSGSGNNNNAIENCTFGKGTSNYQYGVYSAGTASVGNNDNTITESKIFDFWSNGNSSAGIYLDENNSNWIISDNNFYQTETITATGGGDHYGIFSLSSNNISISSNHIGGTDEECGGTAWTVSGSEANTFAGIYLSGENTYESTINGNTISNFNWSALPTANMYEGKGVWTGITYGGGIITVSENTIGASTGTGSIVVETTSSHHVASYGIAGGIDGSSVEISDNTIGSIDVSTNSIWYSHIFAGIQNDLATTVTITGNLIGSESTANSIIASTACIHMATGQHVAGIINNANTTSCSIDNNMIKNLNNATVSEWSSDSGSPFGHTILGIAVTDGVNSISLNTIKRLSTSSIDARTESVRGISIVSDKAGQEINQNSISELSTTNDAGNSGLVGIWYDGPLEGTNTIGSNRIFYITSAYYESLASQIYGIYIADGSASSIKNNMISLGYSETAGHYITGIYTSKNGTFYHNSVVINGDVSGLLDENTYAFRINLATSTAVVKNNLFVNTRTNSGTGKNYAALCQGTIELDYNAYWVYGTGTVLGNDGTDDKTELPIVSGQDQNSINQEVIFTHALGISVADLHTSSSVVNGMADPSVGITTDFDGNTRNPLYPDMGADEFTQPIIIDPEANLDFGWSDVLTPTPPQSYQIVGIDLSNSMVITAPEHFQVSLSSDEGFAQSVSVARTNSNVDATIYARFLPNEESFQFGDITNSSSGVEQTVHVQGSARVVLPVMATGTVSDLTTETATANAEVVHTGGRNVLNRGIIYWAYDGEDKEIGDVGVSNESEAGSFEAGVYSMPFAGLEINTHYNYRSHANNGDWDFGGTGYGETDGFWTLANVPDAPAVTNITGDTVNIAINENLNPANTEFAIHETTTNRYIQADGSMNTNPVWQTKADWGTTIVTLYDVQNRTGNRNYIFEIKARNGAEVETTYGNVTDILTLANTPNIMWVGNITQTSVDISVFTYSSDYSNNTAATLYAVLDNNSDLFVQADATLGITPAWKTRDDWYNFTITDLSIGTEYSFSSIAKNDDGTETDPGPELIFYTLAAVPDSPSIQDVTSTTASITINPGTNPVDLEYLISVSNGQIVQTDGSLAYSPAWQTKAAWDETILQGLAPNTNLSFSVKARNGDNVETTSSEAESIITLAATPGQPELYNYNTFTDKLEFYPSYDTNPQNTEFAVQDSISGLYLQADAYLGESQIWQTEVPASYIFGLDPGTKYAIRVKARNASGIETEWGISKKLSTMPTIPGTPLLSDITTNSISVEIDNNSNPNNVTYAIYENNSSLYVEADGTFSETEIWQTETEWGTTTISDLGVNQNISLKAKAKNDDDAETDFSPTTSIYTLANIPAAPTVEVVSSSSVSIVVNTNDNPNTVFYAIQEVTTGKFVSYYSGLQDVEDWRTIEYWNNLNVVGLEQLTEYTFRVKARNSDYAETNYGQETSVTTPQGLPPAPTLVAPENNAYDQEISLTFSWQEVDGAISYEIEYSIYPDFSIDNHSINGITDLSYETNDLYHNRAYYWHVRATNETGTGPWSERWLFTTIDGPPSIPTLVYPANESIDQLTSVELHWESVEMASSYFIQVSTDENFTELFADISYYQYLYYTVSNLDGNTTYYWRVGASNNNGLGNWSEVWSFTTIDATPDIPVLISPANESTDMTTTVAFEWEEANLAYSYHFQVAMDSEFDDLVVDVPENMGTYYNLYDLAENTTYYWRVKSVNEWDTSDWSEVWWFTTTPGTNIITSTLVDVIIFPNPVDNDLYISGVDEPNVKVSILTETGVEIKNTQLINNSISTKSLKPGIYLLRIETQHGVAIRRFIKQ